MLGFLGGQKEGRGCHHLASFHETLCTTAEQYYKIGGTWTDGDSCNYGWEYDGLGKITCNKAGYYLFVGSSDLKVNKASKITYQLRVNGEENPSLSTPTIFEGAIRINNIGINNIVLLSVGDYLEIFVKSDTANTTVEHRTLFLTFVQSR